MSLTLNQRPAIYAAFLALLLILGGCGGGEKKSKEGVDPSELEVDSAKSNILNIGGELFSVPSPIQTAILIKESGASFRENSTNNPDNASQYTSKYKKALNLGVYGADLGYTTMYDRSQEALSYLNAVRKLAEDLGISGAFDKKIFERFNENMGNKDSILVLVSDAYKTGDSYLKDNDRHDVASLVLAGGWIEALYFATLVAMENHDQEVIDRVGQQKTSLSNLIKLLSNSRSPGGDRKNVDELIQELVDLHELFEDIEYKYKYKKPEVRTEEKTTVLKGEMKVNIEKQQLKDITDKVGSIRSTIIE